MKIKVTKEYKLGFWSNNRIGEEFDAVAGKHPCYPSVLVYFVGNAKSFFIPATCCKVIKEIKQQQSIGDATPIIVTNLKTDNVIIYDSLSEAAKALKMAKSSLHNSIEKGLLINNMFFADYDLSSCR